jgi:hypothetical protein
MKSFNQWSLSMAKSSSYPYSVLHLAAWKTVLISIVKAKNLATMSHGWAYRMSGLDWTASEYAKPKPEAHHSHIHHQSGG